MKYHVLTGALLKIWKILEKVTEQKLENMGSFKQLRKYGRKKQNMDHPLQLVRLNLMNQRGKFFKIIGVVIPEDCYNKLLTDIKKTKWIQQKQSRTR